MGGWVPKDKGGIYFCVPRAWNKVDTQIGNDGVK